MSASVDSRRASNRLANVKMTNRGGFRLKWKRNDERLEKSINHERQAERKDEIYRTKTTRKSKKYRDSTKRFEKTTFDNSITTWSIYQSDKLKHSIDLFFFVCQKKSNREKQTCLAFREGR